MSLTNVGTDIPKGVLLCNISVNINTGDIICHFFLIPTSVDYSCMNYNQNCHPLRWIEFQMPLRRTLAEFKKNGDRNIIFLLFTKTETMLLLNCESSLFLFL